MNLKKVRFVSEILTEQMNHWMLFPIALSVMGVNINVVLDKPNLLLWFICSLFPLALFGIRCKYDKAITFVLLHLALIIVAALIPVSIGGDHFIYIACAIYYVINSFRLRFKRNTQYSAVIQLPVAIVISLISAILQSDLATGRWLYYYTIPLLVVVALFFVIFYIQRYLDFLNVNKSSAGFMPARDMFRSGIGLVAGYTSICIIILLISMHLDLFSGIWEAIKKIVMDFLRYLFSLLPKSDYVETPIEKDESGVSGNLFADRGQTFWIWDLLQFVFLVILIIGIVYLLIKLIIKLVHLIQGHFMATAKNEMQEDEVFDLREKCEIEKAPARKKQNPFDAFSPNERIRRLYKKKLLSSTYRMSQSDRDRLGIYTASEWEKRLDTNGMAAIYENARYSGQEMTGADVRKMKEACNPPAES